MKDCFPFGRASFAEALATQPAGEFEFSSIGRNPKLELEPDSEELIVGPPKPASLSNDPAWNGDRNTCVGLGERSDDLRPRERLLRDLV